MADKFQELSPEQVQSQGGILVLNNMLRALFDKGNTAIYSYGANAAASASEYLKGADGVQFTSSIGYRMPKDGSIVSHACLLNITTATSGDVTIEVRINDSNQSSLELEFASGLGTGVASDQATVDKHAVSFTKGDILTFYATETGTMAWEKVQGSVEIIFDDDKS